MIFVLSALAIVIMICIYFYVRAEGLQRELAMLKRDTAKNKKDEKLLIDAMALIAKKNEEFVIFRFNNLAKNHDKDNTLVICLTPLVANYASIFKESLKGQTNKAIKKSFDAYDARSFAHLTALITKQGGHMKRMWGSNNLNGFMSLVEMLLHEMEQEKK
jgi:hypothetical protein